MQGLSIEFIANIPVISFHEELNIQTINKLTELLNYLLQESKKIILSFKNITKYSYSAVSCLVRLVNKVNTKVLNCILLDVSDNLANLINLIKSENHTIDTHINNQSKYQEIIKNYKPKYYDFQYDNYAKSVMAIYKLLSYHINVFKKETGIDCINNCSHCCNNDHVEASVLEFLPLAKFLWDNDLADEFLDKEQDILNSETCCFYNQSKQTYACEIYPYRALICRLFGFSGINKKNQQIEMYTCSEIKKNFSSTINTINDFSTNIYKLPLVRDYSLKIYQINSALALPLMPVNQAIIKAVILYGFNPKFIKNAS